MTRFDAAEPEKRRALYADAIAAHRARASAFVTIEAAVDPDEGAIPWLQFAEGIVNVDCTEAELESLKALLEDYPAFSIDELARPEEAEGVNVRIAARADDDRVAAALDAIFRSVYELDEGFTAWVVEV
ncbi:MULTISPECIES: hypothetical protein [Saliphagus]|uniref:DUF7975 domain-containing protein n=1 Tax=Saliphagus infecundisoli TaxID=1849069 RepID=A0ABD5QGZ7_9EURY|nr:MULTISPECIES: hypothetical protein [Saliphagus]